LIYDRVAAGEPWEGRPGNIIELRRGIAERIIIHLIHYADPQEVPEILKRALIIAGLQVPVF
jgi:hypothetical protein